MADDGWNYDLDAAPLRVALNITWHDGTVGTAMRRHGWWDDDGLPMWRDDDGLPMWWDPSDNEPLRADLILAWRLAPEPAPPRKDDNQ